eukprot:3936898-Rhodomonas_salina.2
MPAIGTEIIGSVAARGERVAVRRSISAVTAQFASALLVRDDRRQHPTYCTSQGRPPLFGVEYVCLSRSSPITQSSITEYDVTVILSTVATESSPYSSWGGSFPYKVSTSPTAARPSGAVPLKRSLLDDLRNAVCNTISTPSPCRSHVRCPYR